MADPATNVLQMTLKPRVTIGIATYNRDTYLAEAIDSCLSQDYDPIEVLVVLDGTTNPRIDAVLSRYEGEPRLRVIRHEQNRGIAAAYNTFVSAGEGELIAMLGDDDVSLPGRIRRQVGVFDRFPDTGVVHGDATVIDAAGKQLGLWPSRDFSPAQLLHAFFFSHNHLVDPTRMVHRRVYEAVGGYDDRYPLANDLDFWIRAAQAFRFRHCSGGPLTAIRRHGENTSDESSGRAAEIADVEAILERALENISLPDLVSEIDWALLSPQQGERAALLRLADGVERRQLPLPALAARLRRESRTGDLIAGVNVQDPEGHVQRDSSVRNGNCLLPPYKSSRLALKCHHVGAHREMTIPQRGCDCGDLILVDVRAGPGDAELVGHVRGACLSL
jgi:hypothetical protein